jgi:hypothetical protein
MSDKTTEEIVEATKILEDVLPEPLRNFFDKLSDEERRRIFYCLDYILNYFQERRVPELEKLGFEKELDVLKKIGIVIEKEEHFRAKKTGNIKYRILMIKEVWRNAMVRLLKEKYYPMFRESEVKENLRKFVSNSILEASELFRGIENSEISLSLGLKLAKELAKNEIGYFMGYMTTTYGEYSNIFVFRNQPFNVKDLFAKIFEEEFIKELKEFTPVMKWCSYLATLMPSADRQFLVENSTARFLPREIEEEGCKVLELGVGEIGNRIGKVKEIIFSEERERLKNVISKFLAKDPKIVQVIGTLLLLSKEDKEYYFFNNITMEKIKSDVQAPEKFSKYLDYLKDDGVVLTSKEGLIIPKISCEVFEEVVKNGLMQDVKIFESINDAEAFVEEQIMKAKSNVKIWDPYASIGTLAIIERVSKHSPNITFQILSSLPNIQHNVGNLIGRGIKFKAKIIWKKGNQGIVSPFHDRYLIIDEKFVWHFGPSIHDVGGKGWESASLFPENLGKIIVEGFKYNWNKSMEEWKKDGYFYKNYLNV